MIDRRIVKFKLRRGTDDQRKTIIVEEGELIYTTDTKRVYVGDGRAIGGNILANNISFLSGFPASFTANDLLYRSDLGKFYIASTAEVNPWTFVGPYPDTTSINFDSNSQLGVVSAGILPKHISYTVGNELSGVTVSNLSGISVKVNTSHLYFDSTGALSIIPALTGSFALNANYGGLSANGSGVGVKVDGTTLGITNNAGGNNLFVNQISAAQIATSGVNFRTLSADIVAPLGGLALSANTGMVVRIDPTTLKFTNTGTLAVNNDAYTTFTAGVSGYQKLTNGFTIWYGTLSAVNLTDSVSFNIPFSPVFTQVYNAQATLGYAQSTSGSLNVYVKALQNGYMTIGVDLGYNTTPFTGTIYWNALGYS